MDLSLSKFRICALPQTPALNVSWHPTLPIIRLLGVDMTVDQIPEFINFWTSRYRLANNLELAKKLHAALLESHRFMKLLSTIDHRWKRGKLPNGTTGGRILYRRILDDTRDKGQELWRYLLQLLRHSQRLTLEQLGNKETEGWIDAEVKWEFEGEIFFNIFYDNYLFGPPTGGYGIERLVLGFENWNNNCKTWIDAADALSNKAINGSVVGYFHPRRRPQDQHTPTARQKSRPQNSSGPRHVRLAEQTTGHIHNDVSPPKNPRLSSAEGSRGRDVPPMSLPVVGFSTPRLGPQSRPIMLPMGQTTRPMQNSSNSNQVAPPGKTTHVILPLGTVARTDQPGRIPPRSGYFDRRPGRLGRLIQPIRQQSRATTRTHQNSSIQNLVPPPRHAPTAVAPLSTPAPNLRPPSAAGGPRGEVAPPVQRPAIIASQLRPATSPRSPSLAGGASGDFTPTVQVTAMVASPLRPAPSLRSPSLAGGASGDVAPIVQVTARVAPPLRPAPSPRSPSLAGGASVMVTPRSQALAIVPPSLPPSGGLSREVDAAGTRSPPRGRLNYNRIIREHFGVDLDLPPEERVYPEKNFVLVDGDYTLRTEQFPSLAGAGQTSGEVAPLPRPASSPRSPSAAGRASGEIAPSRPRSVELPSAVVIIDLETDTEQATMPPMTER